MLGKVLKYDFKNMGKMLIPLYVMTLGVCLLTRLLYMGAEHFKVFEILSFLTNVTGLLLLVATVVLTFVVVVKRFYTTLFKEEGYLTNVLPVKMEIHILSKLICSLIFNILAVLVFIGSFFIMYYSIELTEGMTSFIGVFKQIIFYSVILIILTLQSYEMLIYAAYSIGQRKNKNKILYSIISGIGLYFISQIISLITIFIVSKVQPNYLELLESVDIEAIKVTLIIANAICIVNIIIYHSLTVWSLNKKMDLE